MPLFSLVRPLIYTLDPETAHGLTIQALKTGLTPVCGQINDPILNVRLWDKTFANPIGLAAGFDKNAEVIAPLLKLGFGFVEAGTVTPKPQDGNPRPRIFRDAQNEAVINRMGFPNHGAEVFRHNLGAVLEKKPRGIIGINIGMNKSAENPAEDYCALIRIFGPYADYLTVNISSPNTPGLRDLQSKENFTALINTIKNEREKITGNKPPLLVKLAPDLTDAQQQDLASAALETQIDGLILTNTTLARPDGLPKHFSDEAGGLSGKPLTAQSTDIIRNFYKLTDGKIPIIGVGGVSSAQDAYDKIRAGASLVQLYSGLIFQGPTIARDICKGLLDLIARDGHQTIQDAVGSE